MKIDSIENALILVGQNNTGKTTILEAIRAAFGDYHISAEDFDGDCANIEMDLSLEFSIEDLKFFIWIPVSFICFLPHYFHSYHVQNRHMIQFAVCLRS